MYRLKASCGAPRCGASSGSFLSSIHDSACYLYCCEILRTERRQVPPVAVADCLDSTCYPIYALWKTGVSPTFLGAFPQSPDVVDECFLAP